jgi:hypothetical protein
MADLKEINKTLDKLTKVSQDVQTKIERDKAVVTAIQNSEKIKGETRPSSPTMPFS